MALADDKIGPLSQQVTQRLEKISNKLRDAGWDGFSTRYWLMADLDPVVHFLGRAAWDPAGPLVLVSANACSKCERPSKPEALDCTHRNGVRGSGVASDFGEQ